MAYIKKEPIIEFITKGLNNPDKTKAYGYDAIEILTEIEYAPTADVVEVKQGEWERIIRNGKPRGIKCSLCGKHIHFHENFCPECGADMRGRRDA
jgi:hypothetical protein